MASSQFQVDDEIKGKRYLPIERTNKTNRSHLLLDDVLQNLHVGETNMRNQPHQDEPSALLKDIMECIEETEREEELRHRDFRDMFLGCYSCLCHLQGVEPDDASLVGYLETAVVETEAATPHSRGCETPIKSPVEDTREEIDMSDQCDFPEATRIDYEHCRSSSSSTIASIFGETADSNVHFLIRSCSSRVEI